MNIDKNIKTPVYLQIIDSIVSGIENKTIAENEQLPSINQIAVEFNLARETVVKAFKILQGKGIIKAVHGKGFFVDSININVEHRVFVLFDTLSAYKEVMFKSIKNGFGKNAQLDIYFHHFNPKVFEKLIIDAAGNYTSYLILPFDHQKISEMLRVLPNDKLYLLDRYPRFYKPEFVGVYQDFNEDIYKLLLSKKKNVDKYNKLILVFRDTVTEVPVELKEGFEIFCSEYAINYEIIEESLNRSEIEKGTAYIVIDDDDLVYLVEQSKKQGLEIGNDFGIISYNETPLKKVVANGISVISTDFSYMGSKVVELIVNKERKAIKNKCRFIDKGSF